MTSIISLLACHDLLHTFKCRISQYHSPNHITALYHDQSMSTTLFWTCLYHDCGKKTRREKLYKQVDHFSARNEQLGWNQYLDCILFWFNLCKNSFRITKLFKPFFHLECVTMYCRLYLVSSFALMSNMFISGIRKVKVQRG